MAFAQSDLNIAILGANDPGIVVNQINPARGQTYVVYQAGYFFCGYDLFNRLFNHGKTRCSLLDPGANGHSGMDQNLSAIHIRKEIAAQIGQQGKRAQDKAHKHHHHFASVEQG